ncbi:hypothetical protein K466DRAFT_587926 [Polyporus arcularius HHB13444]|uniref:C2H2-type domain-containing protein n=1 Tax=Polyporus arcularius HHB13444 TaxID=1314778 RepID=A0A5C3P7K3_9APHY|nr:hypothetical protein K466DRAFT_587926 [Polyporus arcularius HHB13444]
MTGLENAECSIANFDDHIDNIDLVDAYDPFSFTMSIEADWVSTLGTPLPFLPIAPPSVISDDTGSSAGTLFDPLSPVSEDTLPCSPFDEYVSDFPFTGGIGSQSGCDDMAALDDCAFTFQYPSPSVVSSSCSSTPPTTPYFTGVPDLGHRQPVSLHEVGAAATDVYDLGSQGVQGNVNTLAFPSTIPAPPTTGQDPLAPVEEKRDVKKRKDVDEDEDEYKEKKSRSAKRRKQDTTPRFQCPHCDSMHARKNNLKVHISAVHKGERLNACTHPGCERSFSRKHDLTRHIQSRHTDLGSPRRKSPKVAKDDESE